ncbi:MAG: DoxX family protein [Acidobacteriia bacterium]|nr:DoxX family protein [Terriglobia bacterium]
MFTKLLQTRNDWILTLIRVVAGGVMFPHGLQKLLGWFGGAGFTRTIHGFGQMGFAAPLVFLVIMAESFGALGMILGCLSRIAAFSIVVDMTVAALTVYHRTGNVFMNWGGTQKGEGFEFHLLMIAMSLAVMIAGGGAFSVDRALSRNKVA